MKKQLLAMAAAVIVVFSSMSVQAAVKTMPDGGKFDPQFYAATYPDVAAAFGTDENLLYQHYLKAGKAEGRLPYANAANAGASTAAAAAPAASAASATAKKMPDGGLFDAAFYAATYPDVAAVFGNNEALLYQHYLTAGKAEGRLPYASTANAGASTAAAAAPAAPAPAALPYAPGTTYAVPNGIQVVASYVLNDSFSTAYCYVVRNVSGMDLDVKGGTMAYDAAGNVAEYKNSTIDMLAPGHEFAICEYYSPKTGAVRFDTTLSISRPRYFRSGGQDLAYTLTPAKEGVVIQVANTGAQAVRFARGITLFFKNGKLVFVDPIMYFTDENNEIKPGAIITEQSTSFENFDQALFYVNGRR